MLSNIANFYILSRLLSETNRDSPFPYCIRVRKFDHIVHGSLVQIEMILPDRAYAFFSHTHKAQKDNMPLLDEVSHLFYISIGIL